jgi:fucose permease
MVSLLLPIIYLAFISLGLPDGLLGAAWPNMYPQLGVPISYAGIVSMVIAAGTVVSSLLSERLHVRFGAGRVTAMSVLLTAGALFGFSLSGSFGLLCLFAVPYGLGAGSVDAVLNHYVALHYKARHMSWLHCMWGVGCSIGPAVMSRAILHGSWNAGYRTVAIVQAGLTAVLLLSLPLWKDGGTGGADSGKAVRHSFRELISVPGVPQVMGCFFCYCMVESTTGIWASSYCVLARGISPEQAASWASLFYLGITVGRLACGFVTFRMNDRSMIRLGQVLVLLGIVMMLLPGGKGLLLAGLLMVGLGCAPVYPSLIHETPANFGRDYSQGVIGLQMASAYVGTTLMPPLFGLIGQKLTFSLFPLFLLVALCAMFLLAERLHRKTASQRALWSKNVEGV